MEATRPFEPAKCEIAAAVRAVLTAPEAQMDYAEAKLELDGLIDPSPNKRATRRELDRMAAAAELLTVPAAAPDRKLAALRKLLYQSGPWNDHRPFAYDHNNVRGCDVRVKLISHYLETRLGDCVSMPILVLLLAEKLDLDMALVSAPSHMFLRYRLECGQVINLEATSGANPARDEWIRETRPMSDRAIESGLYMRTLSRREGAALMATSVLQAMMDGGRHEDAIAVSQAILERSPRDGLTLANQGKAYLGLLKQRYLDPYGSASLIPLPLRPDYQWLLQRNRAAFAAARALGWQPVGQPGGREKHGIYDFKGA